MFKIFESNQNSKNRALYMIVCLNLILLIELEDVHIPLYYIIEDTTIIIVLTK